MSDEDEVRRSGAVKQWLLSDSPKFTPKFIFDHIKNFATCAVLFGLGGYLIKGNTGTVFHEGGLSIVSGIALSLVAIVLMVMNSLQLLFVIEEAGERTGYILALPQILAIIWIVWISLDLIFGLVRSG